MSCVSISINFPLYLSEVGIKLWHLQDDSLARVELQLRRVLDVQRVTDVHHRRSAARLFLAHGYATLCHWRSLNGIPGSPILRRLGRMRLKPRWNLLHKHSLPSTQRSQHQTLERRAHTLNAHSRLISRTAMITNCLMT